MKNCVSPSDSTIVKFLDLLKMAMGLAHGPPQTSHVVFNKFGSSYKFGWRTVTPPSDSTIVKFQNLLKMVV